MDVICQRCQTRYEFDDALVSSRGTTVKCTQCGHLFRVRAPVGRSARDRWTVRTARGAELTFHAMRELQAAITSGRIVREDRLVGTDGTARRLGDIEELQTFFPDGSTGEPTTVRRPSSSSTSIGVASPVKRTRQLDRDGEPLPSRTGSTLRPPAGGGSDDSAPFEVVGEGVDVAPRPAPVPKDLAAEPLDVATPEQTTQPRASVPPPDRSSEGGPERPTIPVPKASESTGEAVAAMAKAVNAALAEDDDEDDDEPTSPSGPPPPSDEETYDDDGRHLPGTAQVSARADTLSYPPSDGDSTTSGPLTPSPSVGRPSILGRASAFTDPRFSSYESPGKHPSFARWLIGLLVLGVVVVVGFTLLKRYLPAGKAPSAAAPIDERVDEFLTEGEARLAAGDVEGAREQLIMATGVTESDPRVARALTLVEVVRADQEWLHLRLLPEDHPDRARIQRALDRNVKRAAKVADRARTLDPENPESIRLRIDVLRLEQDLAAARNLVEQLPDPGAADAVTLAALDLAEDEPNWPSVLERLRAATREERKLGRARSMLVYALARAGEVDAARQELDAFSAAVPGHPLLEPLRQFVDESPSTPTDASDGGAGGASASADDPKDPDAIPADFREAIRRAHEARTAGNLDRAEQLYRGALESNPGNSEALAGLAEVQRARGNTNAAMQTYQRLLDGNPAYLPALSGLADLKWQSGSRGEAVALYRQVIDASPGSAYADHARARIAESQPATEPAQPPPAPSPSTTAKPAEPPPTDSTAPTSSPPPESTSDLPPGVDVSDLPEFH